MNKSVISSVIKIARGAGEIIKKGFLDKSTYQVMQKIDGSIVTEVDQESSRYIRKKLSSLLPNVPIIDEENITPKSLQELHKSDFCLLVDPLDNTKAFIDKNKNFHVNISLLSKKQPLNDKKTTIKGKVPVFGLIYDPMSDNMYYGYDNTIYHSSNGKSGKIIPFPQKHALGAHSDSIKIFVIRDAGEKYNLLIDLFREKYSNVDVVVSPGMGKFFEMIHNPDKLYAWIRCKEGPSIWDIAPGHLFLKYMGGDILEISPNIDTIIQGGRLENISQVVSLDSPVDYTSISCANFLALSNLNVIKHLQDFHE